MIETITRRNKVKIEYPLTYEEKMHVKGVRLYQALIILTLGFILGIIFSIVFIF